MDKVTITFVAPKELEDNIQDYLKKEPEENRSRLCRAAVRAYLQKKKNKK